jgi:hypothetical protein
VLRKIAYFLQLIDDEPRISLSNIAFLVILGKIIVSPQVDWTALVTLAITCMNVMHDRHTSANQAPDVQELANKMQKIEDKISPVLDKIKGIV